MTDLSYDEEMSLRFQAICVDSINPAPLAAFWREVLGWRQTNADADEIVLEPLEGSREDGVVPDLLFLRVHNEKTSKSRLHIDLRPSDQLAEVERILALGATRVDVGQPPDCTWVVLGDPEGNEFCVLRPFTETELQSLVK